MERSEIRGQPIRLLKSAGFFADNSVAGRAASPDFAPLHPGYGTQPRPARVASI